MSEIGYRISKIKELLEKTTKGPIVSINGGMVSLDPEEIKYHLEKGERGFEHIEYYGGTCLAESMKKDDAEFYSKAKKNIEFLIDEIEKIINPKLITGSKR